MEKENLDYLRKISVFSDLEEEELKLVEKITKLRRYRKNMVIFVEGEYGDELYFVKSGRVKISKLHEDGSEKILHFLSPGDIFAEVLLFGGGEYPATAETMEDSEIGIIENKDLEELLEENAHMSVKILKIMAVRLREAQYHIRDLALRDTYGRLASMLINLGREHGKECNKGTSIALNLSQQQIANMIGSSRETVARILNSWKKDKIIEVDRQVITILNIEALEDWL